MKTAYGLTVAKKETESALRILRNMKLTNPKLKLSRTIETLSIPLEREPSTEETLRIKQQFKDAKISRILFEENVAKPRKLAESLSGKIPDELLGSLPHSFEVIGDIAVIELPQQLNRFSSAVGEGVMQIDPHLRLVLRKTGDVGGTFRTRGFDVMAGEGKTETIHKEFSCLLQLDLAKVYFNPRLSYERMRVAKQVKESECVLDMFAGVGPYSILIAKTQRDCKVYSVDVNPDAFRYLDHNVLLNRVADRVIPLFGDCGQIVERHLRGTVNRVIMNLPSESYRFLGSAVKALKGKGGVIHYYAFASRKDALTEIMDQTRSLIQRLGRKVNAFTFSDIIKEVAPNRVQVALDIMIE